MESCKVILTNFSQSEYFINDSFIAELHENHKWNSEKYWKLDFALFDLAKEYNSEFLPREIIWPIHNIYSFILSCITSHLNPSDSYHITNLSVDSIYEIKERVDLVFDGFFKGKMPQNDNFEYKNPML